MNFRKAFQSSFMLLGSTFSVLSYAELGFENCPGSHCSQVNDNINKACIAAGQSGKPFPVVKPDNSVCTCPCSCVVGSTLIGLGEDSKKPISFLNNGDLVTNIYGVDADKTIIEQMMASDIKNGDTQKIVLDNGSELEVSPNHTFVNDSSAIVDAKSLIVGQRLLDERGQPVTVISNKSENKFTGKLFNLVLNSASPKVLDHIVITNGMQSGDFILQSGHDALKSEIDLRLGTIKPYPLTTLGVQ